MKQLAFEQTEHIAGGVAPVIVWAGNIIVGAVAGIALTELWDKFKKPPPPPDDDKPDIQTKEITIRCPVKGLERVAVVDGNLFVTCAQ